MFIAARLRVRRTLIPLSQELTQTRRCLTGEKARFGEERIKSLSMSMRDAKTFRFFSDSAYYLENAVSAP